MDRTARYLNRPGARLELRHDLPFKDLLGSFRVEVRPKEWRTVVWHVVHLRLSVVNVSIECLKGSLIQLHMVCSLAVCRPNAGNVTSTTLRLGIWDESDSIVGDTNLGRPARSMRKRTSPTVLSQKEVRRNGSTHESRITTKIKTQVCSIFDGRVQFECWPSGIGKLIVPC